MITDKFEILRMLSAPECFALVVDFDEDDRMIPKIHDKCGRKWHVSQEAFSELDINGDIEPAFIDGKFGSDFGYIKAKETGR